MTESMNPPTVMLRNSSGKEIGGDTVPIVVASDDLKAVLSEQLDVLNEMRFLLDLLKG